MYAQQYVNCYTVTLLTVDKLYLQHFLALTSSPVINILSEGNQMFQPAQALLTGAGSVLSCVKI